MAREPAGGDPPDWPGPGPIDLERHDGPHASSTLEWWYVNAHLVTETGTECSLFAAFFRRAVDRHADSGAFVYAHALTWAVVDATGGRYHPESLVDRDAPSIARRRLERGEGGLDEVLRRAMLETLEKGCVPSPDRLLRDEARVAASGLHLDFDGRSLVREADGSYRLRLRDAAGAVGCDLRLQPRKPPVRHGDGGVVAGRQGERMFYYFCPRLAAGGTVTVGGRAHPVHGGWAWYDHEFGRDPRAGAADPDGQPVVGDLSWDWLSAQLDDGSEWTLYALTDPRTSAAAGRFAIEVAPDGTATRHPSFDFAGEGEWTSSRTFVTHPTSWRVALPEAGAELALEPAFPGQEFVTVISKPSFWEGRVRVRGAVRGREVRGLGFVERANAVASADSVDGFLRAVGRATRRSVREVLPLDLTADTAARVVAREDRPDYLDGLDLRQVSRVLIEPVRAVVDRGGKAWRSYVALACCDAVGGDSQALLDWLALPEIVHVGSLIVDDVQDRSDVRRGGPAVHRLVGEAAAINAGTACYFLPQMFLRRLDVPDGTRLRLYDLYFEAVRAAHTGQGLDIDGYSGPMPRVVAGGDGAPVERHVRAVHRLKSAVPASCLGRMGAILGGATADQEAAIGRFLEAVGVGFQIVDDALNFGGFARNLKTRGEDIAAGRVTMPVAKAMSRLDRPRRARLWEIVSSRSAGPEEVAEAIDMVESCGALQACRAEAEELIEGGWTQLEPLLPDSQVKVMLRAFSWFVLDRVY